MKVELYLTSCTYTERDREMKSELKYRIDIYSRQKRIPS